MIPAEYREQLIRYQSIRVIAILFLGAMSYFAASGNMAFLSLCYALMAIGGALNMAVVQSNGKRMPKLVYKNGSEMPPELRPSPDDSLWELVGDGKKTVLFGASVRCKFLADRFRVRAFEHIYSIGDFVSYFGILISLGQLFV